jgi:hypothetical protein
MVKMVKMGMLTSKYPWEKPTYFIAITGSPFLVLLIPIERDVGDVHLGRLDGSTIRCWATKTARQFQKFDETMDELWCFFF